MIYGIWNGKNFQAFYPTVQECRDYLYTLQDHFNSLEIRSIEYGQDPQTESKLVERLATVCDFSKVIAFYAFLDKLEPEARKYFKYILDSINVETHRYICIDCGPAEVWKHVFDLIATGVTITDDHGILRITWTSINIPSM